MPAHGPDVTGNRLPHTGGHRLRVEHRVVWVIPLCMA
jgi:hypothetical protein